MEPLAQLNKWYPDGETYGWLIRIKIEDKDLETNVILPPLTMGRIPLKVQIVDSEKPTPQMGTVTKTREKLILYFVGEPGHITIRIE